MSFPWKAYLVMAGLLGFACVGASAQPVTLSNQPGAPSQAAQPMKISIRVGDKTLSATLADNETARDFASLLPLTVRMDDLFRREKFVQLPRPISTAGPRSRSYEIGDVILWSPGPDVAIYYRHDGQSIPSPGVILIARVVSGVEALDVPGVVNVTFTAVGK